MLNTYLQSVVLLLVLYFMNTKHLTEVQEVIKPFKKLCLNGI